ncbi:transketolase [Candidatus Endowatersipora endosymbiont of Watersipora subatra]|uniref:transketolase n=1 Tax=Candidatus Endowatersipora endosymbiont of Watersipora subatra TaxID=3077946 RepID=UPI00312C9804
MNHTQKQKRMADAIRFLSADAVQKANSGHPGLPMGAADIATVLFTQFMAFDPKTPNWPDRDRFILSAGHGSMLLYSLLFLLGYKDINLEEIKKFRQIDSLTAGHPEYGHVAGIETTTGPLGQGIGNAVGMAIAERRLRKEFGDHLVNHYTYCLVGDGCLMEGISQEAISLAGHLNLRKMIVLWDDNNISIDGPISLSDSTDQIIRFQASKWNTICVQGHNHDEIADAIRFAQDSDKPTMIACKTTIGFGAPTKAGTSFSHGSPLGTDEIARMRSALDWTSDSFDIPADICDAWRIAGLRNTQKRKSWQKIFQNIDSEVRGEFERRIRGDLPFRFNNAIQKYKRTLFANQKKIATRQASQLVLETINSTIPETVGGSADLTSSSNTKTSQTMAVSSTDFSGRFIHYGIREHAMAAAMNGIALHGGLIPYSGGFLIFSDYCRPSIRLAALMGIRVIHVMTHDSIGLGEDGPTHQPVEQLASLRAIPNLMIFRPADAVETTECWQIALQSKEIPSVIALTRQDVSPIRRTFEDQNLSSHGAYEVAASRDEAIISIFASGSEVEIAFSAKQNLDKRGFPTRVVSVPCFELFAEQSIEYRTSVIGSAAIKVGVEAAVRQGWDPLIGSDGIFIGMSSFGVSGPYKEVYKKFGITADFIVKTVLKKLKLEGSDTSVS